MALRLGVTTREEFHIRHAIKAGKSWPSILGDLQDVDPEYVHENFYLPLLEQHKAGVDIADVSPMPGDLPKPSGVSDGPPPGEADPAKTIIPVEAPAGTKKL